MLLVEVPWVSRVWALPFLSALAPSERYATERGRRHKKITEFCDPITFVTRLRLDAALYEPPRHEAPIR
jgi:hypothetical protein